MNILLHGASVQSNRSLEGEYGLGKPVFYVEKLSEKRYDVY